MTNQSSGTGPSPGSPPSHSTDESAGGGARYFAIGDVHGCAFELESLLKKIDPRPEDTVVFLGDYIDRGADSRRVVDLVIALQDRCNVVALKGNHETMFLDFLDRPESPGAGLFVLNGGSSTLANYITADGAIEIPETHMNFFRNLQLCHETDDCFFVHAGVPEIPLAELDLSVRDHEMALLWSRFPFLSSDYKWEKLVVHGHTPVARAELLENRVNIDTGCVYSGKLTAIEFPSRKLHQVEKSDAAIPSPYPREYESSRISMRFSGRLPVQASRGTEGARAYETLNYNQFGMLMSDLNQDAGDYALMNGDVLHGTIGDDPEKTIKFTGTVVRCEARGGAVVYGVRIERVSGDPGGPTWIERPSS